jgi:hypothetical protein
VSPCLDAWKHQIAVSSLLHLSSLSLSAPHALLRPLITHLIVIIILVLQLVLFIKLKFYQIIHKIKTNQEDFQHLCLFDLKVSTSYLQAIEDLPLVLP